MEAWKSIIGYEGVYEVSSHGRVRSLTRIVDYGTYKKVVSGKVLNPCKSRYVQVNLYSDGLIKKAYVHRLVAEAFHKDFNPLLQVDHLDMNKRNNHVSNLEMVTNRVNQLRQRRTTGKRGVTFRKKNQKWWASIRINNITVHLGYFDTENDALQVYFNKYLELHGVQPW